MSNKMTLLAVAGWTLAVAIFLVYFGKLNTEQASPQKPGKFTSIGNVSNKSGLTVNFFEMESKHFLCVIPVHTYSRDRHAAVPFIHCSRK